ncbi:ATP-binding protein [Reichenbachiella ulvae]|uniref:histidine kinase n=1 Tax=Reichenbachiella ulvae TaxID=2980104 RepID=A0ABT3CS13_9BACT|nr:tetratricopeptide repeat-containing sensor histidine kinase [Reichenbachiella ulvae]MCV9386495.1 tetratricopeptide repeat-containing sensor histidine kinase [Reichenbachiella ulvae]
MLGISGAISKQGKHTESIEKSLEAMKIAEAIQDTFSLYDAATNIGIDMYYLEEMEKSLEYFALSAEYVKNFRSETYKSKHQFANALMNVALLEAELGRTENEIQTYYTVAGLFKELGDPRNYGLTLFNMGKSFYDFQEYDSATKYFDESLQIFQKHKWTSAESDVLTSWSNLLFDLEDYEAALKNTYRSLYLARQTNNTLQIQFAYNMLQKLHAANGYFDSAYYYQGKYQELLNESRELEKQEYADDLLAKYETEKKEQQIAQLEQENQIKELEAARQRQLKTFSIVGAVLLLLAIGLLYTRYRDKNKTNQLLDVKNQELARLNTTKDRLFSIISHDLKSPLSSFHSITSSLYSNWDHLEKEQLKDFILSMRDSSADLKGMMNNLLKWALAQSDQLKYEPVVTNPSSIIAEVTRELKTLADLKEISIELNAEDIEIEADRDFLQIVFRNLLSNAMKFSEMKSKIEVMVEEQERDKLISIRDYGVGMEQHQVEDLMGGKITAHEIQNSDQKGTGLGLVLCRELLEKMNARMEVKSELGQGTTFRLVFPKVA